MDRGLRRALDDEVAQLLETVQAVGRHETADAERGDEAPEAPELLRPHPGVQQPVGLGIGDERQQRRRRRHRPTRRRRCRHRERRDGQ